MRKKLFALLFSALMLLSGFAAAAPPEDDPTCERGQASGQECAGDNGGAGCRGLNQAREHAEDTPAWDLVTDILDEGNEGDCDDNQGG